MGPLLFKIWWITAVVLGPLAITCAWVYTLVDYKRRIQSYVKVNTGGEPPQFPEIQEAFSISAILAIGAALWPLAIPIGSCIGIVEGFKFCWKQLEKLVWRQVIIKNKAICLTSPSDHVRRLAEEYCKNDVSAASIENVFAKDTLDTTK